MQTETLALTALVAPPRNVRTHPENQVIELARAVEMFGQTRPVVIDEDNTVLAGNGLVEALKRLGRGTAVTYRVTGLSDADKAKLMLSDNRIWQLGFNDHDAIMELIRNLEGDTDIPGFDPASLEFGPVLVPTMPGNREETGRQRGAQSDAPPGAPPLLACPHCGHNFAR
jgi:hypothetical protein